MTTYPAIIPSSRTFTPGQYPHTPFQALSGRQSRVRHSSVMISSTVQLRYSVLDEEEMIEILDHYNAVKGGLIPFALPAIAWSGNENANEFTLAGDAWRYQQPPDVEEIFCAGGVAGGSGTGYVVQVVLESVPGEGAGLLGVDLIVAATLAAGKAAAANGALLTIQALLEIGGGRALGIAEDVTVTLAAGNATGGVGISGEGIIADIRASLNPGFAFAGLSRVFTVTSGLVTRSAVSTGIFDPDFDKVSLLLHMDGTNGSTTFTDSSSAARTITRFGNAQISTAQSVYGGASGLFDGNGDYLEAAYDSAIDLIGGSFTIECWIRLAQSKASGSRIAAAGGGAVSFNSTTGIHWLFQVSPGGFLELQWWNGTGLDGIASATAAIQLNTWAHVAACFDGAIAYLAIDGAVNSVAKTPVRPSTNPTLGIATIPGENGGSSTAFNGYIDDLRITKGIARYTSNFTPPNAPFPDA
jgi:hypothetical protein